MTIYECGICKSQLTGNELRCPRCGNKFDKQNIKKCAILEDNQILTKKCAKCGVVENSKVDLGFVRHHRRHKNIPGNSPENTDHFFLCKGCDAILHLNKLIRRYGEEFCKNKGIVEGFRVSQQMWRKRLKAMGVQETIS